MGFYEGIRDNTVDRLIRLKGMPAVLRQKTAAAFDPVTREKTSESVASIQEVSGENEGLDVPSRISCAIGCSLDWSVGWPVG